MHGSSGAKRSQHSCLPVKSTGGLTLSRARTHTHTHTLIFSVCARVYRPRGFDWQAGVLRAFSPAGSVHVGRWLWGQGQLEGQRVPKGGHAHTCTHTHTPCHIYTLFPSSREEKLIKWYIHPLPTAPSLSISFYSSTSVWLVCRFIMNNAFSNQHWKAACVCVCVCELI